MFTDNKEKENPSEVIKYNFNIIIITDIKDVICYNYIIDYYYYYYNY